MAAVPYKWTQNNVHRTKTAKEGFAFQILLNVIKLIHKCRNFDRRSFFFFLFFNLNPQPRLKTSLLIISDNAIAETAEMHSLLNLNKSAESKTKILHSARSRP